uniref:Uncharacterized protein n=1 Tax=Sphaerodactylus townsendi TaxID=933632 RepID=A0ACB8ETW3_9SAUR
MNGIFRTPPLNTAIQIKFRRFLIYTKYTVVLKLCVDIKDSILAYPDEIPCMNISVLPFHTVRAFEMQPSSPLRQERGAYSGPCLYPQRTLGPKSPVLTVPKDGSRPHDLRPASPQKQD